MATSRSTLTRNTIMDAAEQLFAEYGYEHVSMRQITQSAHVNLAAVNYHFGSKNALIQAVFQRRQNALNQERLDLLDQMQAHAKGQPLSPTSIIQAYFSPLVHHAYHAGAAQPLLWPLEAMHLSGLKEDAHSAALQTQNCIVVQRFIQALSACLPYLPEAEIVWRFHLMLGATTYAIMGAEQPGQCLTPANHTQGDANALMHRLSTFFIDGLCAALPGTGVQS